MAAQETTLAFPSRDCLIPTISNPATDSVYATIDDLTDGGINYLTFDDGIIPLRVIISLAIVLISLDLLKITQQRNDRPQAGYSHQLLDVGSNVGSRACSENRRVADQRFSGTPFTDRLEWPGNPQGHVV